MEKPDIENRDDLLLIVTQFYQKLFSDKELNHFFIKFKDNQNLLDHHLAILVDFWDQILFFSGTYKKNAMQPHFFIHHKTPIQNHHIDQWINLFNQSVDESFSGQNSNTIKTRALSIATVMKIKLTQL